MSFWKRLFGGARQPNVSAESPAPTSPSPTATPTSDPSPPVTPPTSLPLDQCDVGQLAELFLRSYSILTAIAPGSRPQAQAFDDWLESYRDDSARVIATAAKHAGCPEAHIEIPGGGVFWWEIPDPQVRFLCNYSGISGYMIPRNASPVPAIPDFTPPAAPLARITSVTMATEGTPATPPRLKLADLREKLRDENIMVRLGAVTELEDDGTPDALPGVREAMKNDHVAVRIQSGFVLGKLTEAIVPEWAKPFQGSPIPAQLKAIRKLDQLAVMQAAAVPELVTTTIHDNHMAAVTFAVTGLCRIAQKAVIVSALSFDVIRACESADFAEHVTEIDRLNAAAIAALLGLEAAAWKCPLELARQDAQNTLGTLSQFRQRLMQMGWFLHPKRDGDNDPPQTDAVEVADAVEKIFTGEAFRRSAYVMWLAMRDPAVVAAHIPRLAELLRDPDEELRESVALVFGSFGRFGALAVLELRAASADASTKVRLAAVQALGRIGIAAGLAVPSLQDLAVHETDHTVREAAERAVQQIGTQFAA